MPTDDNPSMPERVARLEADMQWVKKMTTANVIISTSGLISIMLVIIALIPKVVG